MRRIAVLVLLAFTVIAPVACGGDGGPAGPSVPAVAGIYTGTNAIVANSCTGETGAFADQRSISITQTGSSIRITLAGLVLQGSIESSGAFTASGSAVVDGIQIQATMNGSVTGNRLLATEQATLIAPGATCSVVLSFNMTRES